MIASAEVDLAAIRREVMYVQFSTTHNFVPLVFESLDPMGYKAKLFLKGLSSSLDIRN